MDNRERAILKTLLYSDFFDYPLKEEEIFKYLITDKKIDKIQVHKVLKQFKIAVESNKNFYFLSGRKSLVKKRINREKISLQKFKKAKKIIKILSLIPTIRLIGISGTLSMRNSEKHDDIDIFVITQENFVWTTRFLLIIFLVLLGVYRTRNSKNYSDKICLNMMLDEGSMKLEKNLYIAHEISQLVPVFEKDNTYKKFLLENKWIENFMINALNDKKIYLKKKSNTMDFILNWLFDFFAFEKIAKYLQLIYMKKHITSEIVKPGVLRLHPFDYKSYILQSFNKKINELGL
jgi:hypothetical protein